MTTTSAAAAAIAASRASRARSSRSCGRPVPRRPAAASRPRTRAPDRCRACSAPRWSRRAAAAIRRRLGLEERLRRLRGGGRPVPAQVRRRHGRARRIAPPPCCRCWPRWRGLLPSHTRRSEESETLPAVLHAAPAGARGEPPRPRSRRPTTCWSRRPAPGLLAIFAELAGASLVLNELAETRAGLLGHLFPDVGVTRFDAAQIDDHLDPGVTPTVVLMNPPFSALANVDRRRTDAALRHVSSALARLAEGGRLVAITQASLAPDSPAWREDFVRLQERGTVVFSAAIDGAVYARHGTTIETRLTVIDKRAAADATAFPASPGTAPDAATLLRWVMESVPPRLPIAGGATRAADGSACRAPVPAGRGARIAWVPSKPSAPSPATDGEVVELAYETVDWKPAEGGRLSEALYEDYALQSIRIPGAHAHPTRLVQSAAMASVAPPKPTYRPHLPAASSRRASCPTPSWRASSTRARRMPRISPARGRWTPPSMSSPPRPTMRQGRRALPARLVPGRRHRLRQGPPGGGHHPRQLAQGPAHARCGSPSPRR